jgi:hypothetical protein
MADKLTLAYQAELKKTRLMTGSRVQETWKRLGSYNEDDVPRFLAQVEPIVRAGQQRASSMTSAYLSRKLNVPPVAVPLNEVVARVRNGTPMAEVYRRPFVEVWGDLHDNQSWADAVQSGGKRAFSISGMDVLLAFTAAMVVFSAVRGAGERVVGYQRISDPNCCEYCSMLDGVVTGPDEPMPIHNNCGCTADPLLRETAAERDSPPAEPGDTVDKAAIEEHGEYGPVITVAGQRFTGPSDLG